MWRSVASNALTVLLVLGFVGGGGLLMAQARYTASGPLEQAICVKVDRGSTMRRVSEDLEAKGAITSGPLFRIGADYADKSQSLKAGSFRVPAGASMDEIVDIVTRGGRSTCGTEVVYRVGITRATVQVRALDPATNRFEEQASFNPAEGAAPEAYTAVRDDAGTRFRIALAEGVTSWQIVQELNQIDVLTGEVADIPPEGALAPDSYEIRPGDSRQSVIDRMFAAQQRVLSAAWDNRVPGLPYASPQEALIMASIIEKETGVASERRTVASVFVNRLREGMRLQTDPTVIYGITRGQGALGRGLRRSELDRRTPWNTYQIDGLPPTPIANPGRAAIEAALDPETTNFLFFVADGTGGHEFNESYAAHQRAVQRLRARERDGGN